MKCSSNPRRNEVGLTMVEAMVAVAIIGVLAAVGMPGFMAYLRNSQVRGAQSSVASEIGTARSKAIMRNVNQGVVFVVVDQDSYRWIMEDPPGTMGPLRHLPNGVRFAAPGAGADRGFRYNRLGSWCDPGVATCAALPATVCTGAEVPSCSQNPGNYVTNGDALNPGSNVTVEQPSTGLRRVVNVAPGGRVLSQP
jgi:type II secretory pathway pseudopilin PulG